MLSMLFAHNAVSVIVQFVLRLDLVLSAMIDVLIMNIIVSADKISKIFI